MADQDIAIVGISILCPAGETAEEFWHGIATGTDFITEVTDDIIEAYHFEGVPNGIDRFYCKRGGFTKPVKVDPLRYGIMPITAEGTDPEQLISLAGTEMALLDAGVIQREQSLQNCSIIIGKGNFFGLVPMRSFEIMRTSRQITALLKIALPDLTDDDLEKVKLAYQSRQGTYQPDMAIGTMPNLIASLVANRFDMHGPAYTIDAACASGIVAINHSISLLQSGQCDIAVAGAMHSAQSAMFWGAFDMLGAMSKKEVIAPFSEEADGLLVGQGGGFVVLKTLERAKRDNDRIYAVIKSTAVSSDGAASHVMVTSVEGQMRVLEQAWAKSGLDKERIGYIEAHGTGTIVGDRTEITTLKDFFGDNSHPRAYVGSVKSNIGHTMPAAGMIGLIKTALALYWRKIPPTLHCEKPLAAMYESRFLPPQELIDWDGEELPLVAGVNAFGFGGINAHAILTAYEPDPDSPPPIAKRLPYLGEALMVSATDGAKLVQKLERGDYTNTGGNWRVAIFSPDSERIRQAISIVERGKPWHGRADIWFSNQPLLAEGGKIVYLFPGFTSEWDTETDSISEMLELPYLKDLIAERDDQTEESRFILRAYYTEWLAKEGLQKLGINADMHAGHSVGEWDATLFAGITDGNAEELRTRLISSSEYKSYPMIAVGGVSRTDIEAWCEQIEDIWLVSDNCPNQVIICGLEDGMNRLMETLDKARIFYTVMPFGVGMHTPLIAEDVPSFEAFLEGVQVQTGSVPVWSSSTLELIPTDKEQYVKLVVQQMIQPVFFRELIEKLYEQQSARIFIQLGPGSLTGFVEDTLKDKHFGAISTVQMQRGGADQLRRVLALLFVEGHAVDAGFMGVKPIYRAEHSLLILPSRVPPILTDLPELDAVVKERYGQRGVSAGLASLSGELEGSSGDPVALAVNDNIRDAIAAQQELYRIFEQSLPSRSSADRRVESGAGETLRAGASRRDASHAESPGGNVAAAAKAPGLSRKGTVFEEPLHLTLEEHPYLLDHAVIRQPVDWPISDDLNPVVPFTMTIELLAEVALRQVSGEKLIRLENIQALRWIELERPFDAVVKGEWIADDVLLLELGDYARAECVFADQWPEPAEKYLDGFDIGPVIMERYPSKTLYEKFSFHGPQYHSAIYQEAVCARGMKGKVQKQPGKGSLLDCMGQQLGLYLHLTQTENTISFPIRLKELCFYSDIFDQEGIFDFSMLVTRLNDSIAAGDMMYRRDGKIWCTAHDFVVQRFANYLPVWEIILRPQTSLLAEKKAPGVFYTENSAQNNLLFLLAKRYLSVPDREKYASLSSAKQQREHIISRIALKDAVRDYTIDENGLMLFPIEFYCLNDETGKPSVHGYGQAADIVDNLCVSITHKGDAAAAIVSDKPVGIDLEMVTDDAGSEGFLSAAFTDSEKALLESMDDLRSPLRFWVAKEATAKKAGSGLKGNPKAFEVTSVEGDILTVGDDRVQTMDVGESYILGWTLE